MRHRGGGRGEHLLAALTRLYGALLVLYPEAFRRRYSEEMRRDFRELMREGLEEGGAKELVRVWAQAHSDLALTALKERGTTSGSRYAAYSSVDPRIAARAAAKAMVAVVLVAVGVTSASLLQTPSYEASAQVWVDQKQGDQHMGSLANQAGSGEMIKTLPPKGAGLQAIIQPLVYAIDSRPVAEKAVERLGLQREPVGRLGPMGAAELLDKLTVEQVEDTTFIVLTYEDIDPVRAKQIVNTVSEVSSEFISERSSQWTANVYEEAVVPESPASPHPFRNGLLTLAIGLVLSAVLVLPRPRLLAARVADSLVGPAVRPIGEAEAELRIDPSEAERSKQQELLEALGRRGKLTAVEASLETVLSVEEANRLLFDLVAKGHLQVTAEDGKLLYSFWESTEHE